MLGAKALTKGIDMANALYLDKISDIQDAWDNGLDGDGVTISLSIRFSPAKKTKNAVSVDASCSFVKERVKVSDSADVQEGQEELFAPESEPARTYYIDPDKKMEATP